MKQARVPVPRRIAEALVFHKIDVASVVWWYEVNAGPRGGPGTLWLVGFQQRLLLLTREEYGEVQGIADLARRDVRTVRVGWTFLGEHIVEFERAKGEPLLLVIPSEHGDQWPTLVESLRAFAGKAFAERSRSVRVDQGMVVEDGDAPAPGVTQVAMVAGPLALDPVGIAQSIRVTVDPAIRIGGAEATRVECDAVGVRVDPLPAALDFGVGAVVGPPVAVAMPTRIDGGSTAADFNLGAAFDSPAPVDVDLSESAMTVDATQRVDTTVRVDEGASGPTTRCSVCREDNPADALICHFCDTPLPVWDVGSGQRDREASPTSVRQRDRRASTLADEPATASAVRRQDERVVAPRTEKRAAAERAAPRRGKADRRPLSLSLDPVSETPRADFSDKGGCCGCSGCLFWIVFGVLVGYILSFFTNPQ